MYAFQNAFHEIIELENRFVSGLMRGEILGDIPTKFIKTEEDNGSGKKGGDKETIKYSLPGDVRVKYILASLAGSDPTTNAIRCNIRSLDFVNWFLGYLAETWKEGKNGPLDMSKAPKTDAQVEEMAWAGNTESLLNAVGANYHGMNSSVFSIGQELLKGNLPYVVEYNGVGAHRVVIVEITFNVADIDRSSARVYNPASGKIEERPNFFMKANPNNPMSNKMYIWSQSYIISK